MAIIDINTGIITGLVNPPSVLKAALSLVFISCGAETASKELRVPLRIQYDR
jgi:hypothetical protein